MKRFNRSNPWRFVVILSFSITWLATSVGYASAASWNGIEPLKSRREEVLKTLGKPVAEDSNGALHFVVAGGTVSVLFVDQKFVNNKKLRVNLEGTVLEIVLQHDHSNDTPETMNLPKNHNFVRDDVQNASIFRNIKDGIVYTFLDGKLRTTRLTFSDSQLFRARR